MFRCAEFYSSTEPVDLLDHSKFMWSLLTQNVAARSVSAHMGVLVNVCASERLCVDPCGRVCVCVCVCMPVTRIAAVSSRRDDDTTASWWMSGRRDCMFFYVLYRNSAGFAIQLQKMAGDLQDRLPCPAVPGHVGHVGLWGCGVQAWRSGTVCRQGVQTRPSRKAFGQGVQAFRQGVQAIR